MRLKFRDKMGDSLSFGQTEDDHCGMDRNKGRQLCWKEAAAYTLMADKPGENIGDDVAGAIIGAVVGVIIGIAIIVVVIYCLCCKKKQYVQKDNVVVVQAPAPA